MQSLRTLTLLSLTAFLFATQTHAQPRISYFPDGFDADSEEYPANFWGAFNIGNSGDELLTWSLELEYINSPGDNAGGWLIPLMMEGETGAHESSIVPLRINTANMQEGQYDAEIRLSSNDPRDQILNFPVSVSFGGFGTRAMQLLPEEVKFEGHYELLEVNNLYFASVIVPNLTEEPIHLDSAVIVPDIFEFNFEEIDVQPGEYAIYGITFTTQDPGEFIGTLTLYSSDAGQDGAQFIPISASVFESSTGSVPIIYPSSFILYPFLILFNTALAFNKRN